MPLGTEVGLGPGHTVLDGDPAPPQKGVYNRPHFSAHVYCDQTSPISATAELLSKLLHANTRQYIRKKGVITDFTTP